MGSQLSAMAPTSIHPVEYYLTDSWTADALSFDANLGSTRFLKVARVRMRHTENSLAVAKVFVIPDPSLPIRKIADQLDRLKSSLMTNPNALPFTKVVITEKAAILLRQYVKYSLYDRLSTRPFLTTLEKKWITFQLMLCLQSMHRSGVTHGDLKLENILLTSYLWVLVTDFAPFKPTFLPDDNPSDFSFFFDSSRRRTCNLARERFVSEEVTLEDPNNVSEVTPQMDLFALGCVLAELFADSSDFQLFDLATILSYKPPDGVDAIRVRLESKVKDPDVRSLILNLIQADPKDRMFCSGHLTRLCSGGSSGHDRSFFPSCFDSIFDYFRKVVHLPPDVKVVKMEQDLKDLVAKVTADEPEALLLLLLLITSNIRSLKHIHPKVSSLRLIVMIVSSSSQLMSQHVLDRLLPHVVWMARDESPRVRREAVDTMTLILETVHTVPSSDANVFTDYILPILEKMANDKSPFVRVTVAKNLRSLASSANKFLDLTHSVSSPQFMSDQKMLLDSFQKMVSHLLIDSANEVKRTLIESDIGSLCVFLGRSRTNDVILSHIITFLNDKEDHDLRGSFFDNLVPIASFLGSQSSSILKPLLQQGLTDSEEFVIHRTLMSLASFSEIRFLDESILLDLMKESSPLLLHPNLWIRHAMVSFVTTLSTNLSLAQVYCKVMPLVSRYLTQHVHVLTPDLMIHLLKPCVPREVYTRVISPIHTPQVVAGFFQLLKDLKANRSHAIEKYEQQIVNLYHRLVDNGMDEEMRDKLVDMSSVIMLIFTNKNRSHQPSGHLGHRRVSSTGSGKTMANYDPAVIVLDLKSSNKFRVHSVRLTDDDKVASRRIRNMALMNDDWKHMFGAMNLNNDSDSYTVSTNTLDCSSDTTVVVPIAEEAKESTPCPPCSQQLTRLINHKKDHYEYSLWSRGVEMTSPSSSRSQFDFNSYSVTMGERVASCPNNKRPRGSLLSHLHEHQQSVNRLVPILGSSIFASCSSDGFIKTWGTDQSDPKGNPITKSLQSTQSNDLSPFMGMTYCHSLSTLIGVTSKSVLHVYSVDTGSSMLRLTANQNLGESFLSTCEEALTPQVTDLVSCSPFSLMASFSNSTLCGYDLRTSLSSSSFKCHVHMRDGFITSITGTEYCVFAATSSGAIYTFDTRFLLKANLVRYNDRKRIRRLLYTPKGLYASVKGNNEVTLFDCETGFRQGILWASRAPILSANSCPESTPDSVLGMQLLASSKSPSSCCLITAGTDMRIRVWDLQNPSSSYILSDGLRTKRQLLHQIPGHSTNSGPVPFDSTTPMDRTFQYTSKVVEAIDTIQEEEIRVTDHGVNQLPQRGAFDTNAVSTAHHDTINDVIWMEQTNCLVSASRDGVIKLWN